MASATASCQGRARWPSTRSALAEQKYIRCPAIRSPSRVSIGSRPVTRAHRLRHQRRRPERRARQPHRVAAAEGGGDPRQQVAQRHVLAAEDMPLPDRAAGQRGDAAGGHIVHMHQVQPGIDIGRHPARAPLPG